LLDGEVVEQVAGLEVVGGVEQDLGRRVAGGQEQLGDVGWGEVGDAGVDGDAGVEEGDVAAGGLGFGEAGAGVGFVEEELALQVGGLNEVAVDEGERACAGAGEQRGGGGAGGSAADDGDVRGGQALLAEDADAGEEDLAGVAVSIGDRVGGRGRRCRGRGPGGPRPPPRPPPRAPRRSASTRRRIRLNAWFFVV